MAASLVLLFGKCFMPCTQEKGLASTVQTANTVAVQIRRERERERENNPHLVT